MKTNEPAQGRHAWTHETFGQSEAGAYGVDQRPPGPQAGLVWKEAWGADRMNLGFGRRGRLHVGNLLNAHRLFELDAEQVKKMQEAPPPGWRRINTVRGPAGWIMFAAVGALIVLVWVL